MFDTIVISFTLIVASAIIAAVVTDVKGKDDKK